MKFKAALTATLLTAATLQAQLAPPPIIHEIEANSQQVQTLDDVELVQGANAVYQVRLKSRGKFLPLAGMAGRLQIQSAATSTQAVQLASAATVTSTVPNYIEFRLASTETGTAVSNWLYSVAITDGTNTYPMGIGRIDIAESTWTGGAAVLYQARINWALISSYTNTSASGPYLFNGFALTTNEAGQVSVTAHGAASEVDPVFTNWLGTNIPTVAWGDVTDKPLAITKHAVDMDQDVGTTNDVTFGSLTLPTNTTIATGEAGQIWFDGTSFNAKTASDVTLQLGEETVGIFKAAVAITNGQAVYMFGESGDHITIAPATATVALQSRAFLGLATEDIASGALGRVTVFGLVRKLSATQIPFPAGSDLFLNGTAGAVSTNVSDVYVGKVGRVYGPNVDVFVMPYYDLTTFDYKVITNAPWVASTNSTYTNTVALATNAVQPTDSRALSFGNVSVTNLTASGAITGATLRVTGAATVSGVATVNTRLDVTDGNGTLSFSGYEANFNRNGNNYIYCKGASADMLVYTRSTNLVQRWTVLGNTLIKKTTDDGVNALQVNGSASVATNLTVSGSITAGSYSPSIIPFALTSAPTTTITSVMGDTVSLLVTNDISRITLTLAAYDTNATHTICLGLDNTANKLIGWDTNTIFGATSLSLTNKVYTFTLHKGWRQDRFEILKGGYEK